jgi:hypothetical protein
VVILVVPATLKLLWEDISISYNFSLGKSFLDMCLGLFLELTLWWEIFQLFHEHFLTNYCSFQFTGFYCQHHTIICKLTFFLKKCFFFDFYIILPALCWKINVLEQVMERVFTSLFYSWFLQVIQILLCPQFFVSCMISCKLSVCLFHLLCLWGCWWI